MDESKKKPIMIGVIVVCLTAAGIIAYTTSSGRSGGIPPDFATKMTWVKCRNPNCEHEYEITLKEYYEYLEKHSDPSMMMAPALVCTKCGEESVYQLNAK
jgi:hypothetical protein